jgi:hypothetical protein
MIGIDAPKKFMDLWRFDELQESAELHEHGSGLKEAPLARRPPDTFHRPFIFNGIP